MNKTGITIIILIAIGILGFVLFSGGGSSDVPADSGGEVTHEDDSSENSEESNLPSNTFETADGEEVTLERYAGKPLVVNLWATWCPFCTEELPDFGALQEELGESAVVIAINRGESVRKAEEFTDSLGITDDLTYLYDPRDRFYRSIGGFSMPETLFIDADGDVVVHKRGFMELSEMRELASQITSTN